MRAVWKSAVLACIALQSHRVISLPHHGTSTSIHDDKDVCQAQISPFDYSAKIRSRDGEPGLCFLAEAPIADLLMSRQSSADDDYSCSETKPCKNGACCPKATGFCNYGEKACGTTGTSPNDVCWSNCDAHAECGRNSDPPGKECPLNVCCSQFGFCGTTAEFCKKTDDEEESCQSNCDQPGSGSSGGDVQRRVIGYYEGWAHDRECQNMNFKDIPVGALTHAYFSFAYITPGNFLIAPMDDLKADLFEDFTAIKSGNPGLKAIVAVGGWTFNDPGATQAVFSDMVSSAENRKAFIGNLMGFMRKYGFDGVDFDWEYPGAPDRGGKEEDGKNFVTFLKELDDVNKQQPEKYIVSFTVPTSYWYLRWFDLKAIDYVDWVNVMSYDLHGVWDSTNPIGNQVLAHTNLTEIKLALDLFWRNGVEAEKLNLGLGFYGRSFQLSDPTCHEPGCQFKGGASPGPCSQNSGTLTYREIMDVIKNNKLKPYYDKENAVKYITWNQDQWVSYDDAETFKQKIDFANEQGLGGLLIWAIDQDTDDLQALRGVVGDNNLKLFQKEAQTKDLWEGVSVPDCYVTDCGGHCNPGWVKVTHQPCGGAKFLTRHSTEEDSELCCPLDGAPSEDDCRWRGSAPSCNGHCQENEVTVELNRWGDGKYCEDGNKAYCCDTSLDNTCYWTGAGSRCNGDDVAITFAGTFLERLADIAGTFFGLVGLVLEEALDEANIDLLKLYCCPKKDASNWENCAWYGKPGSCFDNHCPVGHSVQLTTNAYGEGEDCGIRLERSRVFCCDPAGGQSPFLPVSLDKLFPNPPEGDDVDTDYELETDDTWGTGTAKVSDDEPSDAAFQFVVMASPEELQTSLDRRDGSHWLLNCENTTNVEELQKVKMICTDVSENSNCHKIGLGHGVPGTILQMPPNCGIGKYAVAVDMTPSPHQILPRRVRRSLSHRPIVYDLTFDYDFTRVPRDIGDTQVRIDFSNEVGYWDEVVAAAASKRKSKRSLDEFHGNHVRWLEEEYRDDAHFGLASRDELHARWFGSDILEWLREMLSPTISREYRHVLDKVYLLKIVDETWQCPLHDGRLLAQAETDVRVESSFGFTIVCKLPAPGQSFDLSQSYLTFSNKGDITAIFRLEAYLDLHYDSMEKSMLRVPFPGASFYIPGIAEIGPAVNLKARVEAQLVVSAVMETRVDIASWEFEQTLPASNEYKPSEPDMADYGKTGDFNGIQAPEFYAGITADGRAKLHAIAAIEFGIKINERWNVKGDALASVVADGWIEATAHSSFTTEGNCPFTWGVNIGVDLYAKAEAPSVFNWNLPRFNLPGSGMKSIIPMEECPDPSAGLPDKRDTVRLRTALIDADDTSFNASQALGLAPRSMPLEKRERITVQPVIKIGAQSLLCPEASQGGNGDGTPCENIKGWEPDQFENALRRRYLIEGGNSSDPEHWHQWNRRVPDTTRTVKACLKTVKNGVRFLAPAYETSGSLNTISGIKTYGFVNPAQCNSFDFDGDRTFPTTNLDSDWATEHILELQLISQFVDKLNVDLGKTLPNYAPGGGPQQTFCQAINTLWVGANDESRFALDGVKRDPINHVLAPLPGNGNPYVKEFVLLDRGVNTAKERMFSEDPTVQGDDTMLQYEGDGDRAVKNLKDVMTAMKYLQDPTIAQRLRAQKERIAERWRELDVNQLPNWDRKNRNGASYGRWVSQGLEGRWNNFVRDKCATARAKAVAHIDEHLPKLREAYINDFKRGQAEKQAAAGDSTLKNLIEKIEMIETEWMRYKPISWTNPF
ncbi:putative glycosyl hydrolases family 18 protein [Rosellinia necatrix]|uniref:chitinase n=1 Tax=Rosellinia necatrix TaxID=77044 RepID=A0A1W2TD66_ROSNE|nr:putative glycosyl hydrolases family 18 protein [Rosellinia necatrix]